MTEGTDASRRITGIAIRRRRTGASSTMKIDESTASTTPISTAGTVVMIVPQISGQARKW